MGGWGEGDQKPRGGGRTGEGEEGSPLIELKVEIFFISYNSYNGIGSFKMTISCF